MKETPSQTRILHVTTVPMTLRFLKGQLSYMKARGYDISIISSPGPELLSFGAAEEVSVDAVPMVRRIAPIHDLISLLKLCGKVRMIQPHIVHSHTPKGGLLGMCAAAITGVPVRIYHLRGLPMATTRGPKRELLRWTERLSCALAHDVVCVSGSLRDLVLKEKLCPEHKLHVLAGGSGNGVDSENAYAPPADGGRARREAREQLNIPENALVLGFVGRLVRDKGIVELWQAWQVLRARFGEAVLLLIGPEETADSASAEVLRSLREDPRVHLTGLVPSAAPFYPAMDVLVLPTYREGFPNCLLEAASMELPVVATAVTGCIDAVSDGETGTLVPPTNSEALAVAITRYLENEELRREHGRKGRARVRELFCQERIWRALAQLYSDAISTKFERCEVRDAA